MVAGWGNVFGGIGGVKAPTSKFVPLRSTSKLVGHVLETRHSVNFFLSAEFRVHDLRVLKWKDELRILKPFTQKCRSLTRQSSHFLPILTRANSGYWILAVSIFPIFL